MKKDEDPKKKKSKWFENKQQFEETWKKLKMLSTNGSVIICKLKAKKEAKDMKVVLKGNDTGLHYNQIYSIIDTQNIFSKHADNGMCYQLLWILPKDNSKWKGEWGKGSAMYNKYEKKIQKFAQDRGEMHQKAF